MHGVIVLDKPVGITSRGAVDRALRWFPAKTKIGHTGTLDPLASGVLVLCVGHTTRLTEYVQDMAKTYVAELILGARSLTDDAEGPISPSAVERLPDRTEVETALSSFLGSIEQVPPGFSAAKVAGRRAYALARRGMAVELTPRTVRIDRIDMSEFAYPHLRIEVQCGKGTYIRSLARDVGEYLGCGAYVGGLRRIRVGPFSPEAAVPLDVDAETAYARLLPPAAAVAGLARVTLSTETIARIRMGQSAAVADPSPDGAEVAAFNHSGELVAIARAVEFGSALQPLKVFPE
jgi:tRNA pseudouridine55 synthase